LKSPAIVDAMKKIYVMHIASLDQLLASLSGLVTTYSPRIVVIDSLATLVHGNLGAKMATLTRLQTLAGSLKRVAAEYQLTVVLVNHQLEATEEEGSAPRAALGTTWQMVPNVKILFARHLETWTATLVRGSNFKKATVKVEF